MTIMKVFSIAFKMVSYPSTKKLINQKRAIIPNMVEASTIKFLEMSFKARFTSLKI